jgi:hypothetical protein
MTLGSGILWSTVLLLLAVAIYQVSTHHKWKTVGKVFGVLILCGVLISGAIWGWYAYQNRPQVVTELDGVRLGMTPLEVKLLKGAPTAASEMTQEPDRSAGGEEPSPATFRLAWTFGNTQSFGGVLYVVFRGAARDHLKTSIICETDGYDKALGLGRFNSEREIVEKLGSPSEQSIDRQGLKKTISYKRWNVAYEITKGSVSSVCITASGRVRYRHEYDETESDAQN